MVPVVIFEHGLPKLVGSKWRQSKSYRRYRDAIDSAQSYREVVALLEAALRDPDKRLSVTLDFSPKSDYARRFISTTGLFRTKPRGSEERRLAERATRIMIHLLCAGGARPGGRPIGKGIDPHTEARAREAVSEWLTIVRPLWHAAGEYKKRLPSAIALAGKDRLQWSAAHQHELTRMVMRRSTRPSAVAVQLAAWQLGLSVHQVRRCRRRPDVSVLHA